MFLSISIYAYIFIYISISIYLCIHIYLYIYLYLSISSYIYTHLIWATFVAFVVAARLEDGASPGEVPIGDRTRSSTVRCPTVSPAPPPVFTTAPSAGPTKHNTNKINRNMETTKHKNTTKTSAAPQWDAPRYLPRPPRYSRPRPRPGLREAIPMGWIGVWGLLSIRARWGQAG